MGAAEVFWGILGEAVPTKAQALAALDAVGQRFRGADAEFDDYLEPGTPLGRMVAIAFDATPDEVLNVETDDDGLP